MDKDVLSSPSPRSESYNRRRTLSPDPPESDTEFANAEQTRGLLPGDELKYKSSHDSGAGSSNGPHRSWWARTFERPDWLTLGLHVVLCGISFCLVYLALPHARGPLFWVRLYVGLVCSFVGVGIGFTLLRLARRWMEAAVWATLIHQSLGQHQSKMQLGDLVVYTANGASLWATCKLMFDRWSNHDMNRQSRRSYDKRPWSLFLLFFLLCLVSTGLLSFVLGRVANIDITTKIETDKYREIAIAGDLSDNDLDNARSRWDWQISGINKPTDLLPTNDQSRVVSKTHNGSTIYFAEAISAQLWEGGHGLGNFENAAIESVLDSALSHDIYPKDLQRKVTNGADEITDMMLRYPKWGLRVECGVLPDLSSNLVVRAKSPNAQPDYAFIPLDFLKGIYDRFGMQIPQEANGTDALDPVINNQIGRDNMPDDFDGDTSKWIGVNTFSRLNATLDVIQSVIIDDKINGMGWSTMDLFLVRLDQNSAPAHSFSYHKVIPVTDPYNTTRTSIDVGFEVVVCVQVYEPWIVEVYNATSGGPSTMRVLGRGNEVTDLDGKERIGQRLQVNHTLSSLHKLAAFTEATENFYTYAMLGSDNNLFQPTSALAYFTNTVRKEDYKGLNTTYFTHARGIADATLMLPYLAGSGKLAARTYKSYAEASVRVDLPALLATLGAVLLFGIVAALLTPRLPRDAPRREFGLYSWLAAIHGDHFLHELRDGRLQRGMDIEAVEKALADNHVSYAI